MLGHPSQMMRAGQDSLALTALSFQDRHQVVLGGGIDPRLRPGASAAVMVPQIMRVIETQFNGTARATALSAYGWCWRAVPCQPEPRDLLSRLTRGWPNNRVGILERPLERAHTRMLAAVAPTVCPSRLSDRT